MSKFVTLYKPNPNGEIEKIETVDGVVVEEGAETGGNMWENVWKFFYANGATVGGNDWEKKYRRETPPPTDGNGMVYNSASDNWEYPASDKASARPCAVNYEIVSDYQGSVPQNG